jgi:hypothetical protein
MPEGNVDSPYQTPPYILICCFNSTICLWLVRRGLMVLDVVLSEDFMDFVFKVHGIV